MNMPYKITDDTTPFFPMIGDKIKEINMNEYRVSYGENVVIYPNVTIQKGYNIYRITTIGDNTTIGNNVIIGHGTRIGKNCIIYPNCVIGSDVTIGDNVIIYSCCVISTSAVIINNVTIHACSNIGFHVLESGTYSSVRPQILFKSIKRGSKWKMRKPFRILKKLSMFLNSIINLNNK